jgi:hypothetical protein
LGKGGVNRWGQRPPLRRARHLPNDVAYIHTLVTGGFNPHRRLHLESAGLWLDLQTCNLLYSIFPDVSYRMLKILINSRI